MSRIGARPVAVPSGVEVTVKNQIVTIAGPRGSLSRPLFADLEVVVEAGAVTVKRLRHDRLAKTHHGLVRQVIAGLVHGVTNGFNKKLEMKGTGYRAEVIGNDLVLQAGFSHPVRVTAPEGIKFSVEKNTLITVEGNDKQLVGAVAAQIRAVRPPEPYKGKGIRYVGELIRRKAGKAAAATAKPGA